MNPNPQKRAIRLRRLSAIFAVLLAVVLLISACSQPQRAVVQTLVAAQIQPTETPVFSPLMTPTPLPTMGGVLGTLTAIAPLVATPVQNTEPYVIVNRGNPHFLEFHAWW